MGGACGPEKPCAGVACLAAGLPSVAGKQQELSCAHGMSLCLSYWRVNKFVSHSHSIQEQRRSQLLMQAWSCGGDHAAALCYVCLNIVLPPILEPRKSSHRALLPQLC